MLNFTMLLTIAIVCIVFRIVYTKNKDQKFKLMAIFAGAGSFIVGIEIAFFMRLSLFAAIIAVLATTILGGLWPLGFWLMRNDFRTKVGLMKDSQRESEEQQVKRVLREMFRIDKKGKGTDENQGETENGSE